MSEEGDTFFISLAEKLFGVFLIIIGAIMLYLTSSTSALGGFSLFFGILSLILLIIGLFLLLVRPSE
jgi:ABC-type tungstate transport system substrate-binding protein